MKIGDENITKINVIKNSKKMGKNHAHPIGSKSQKCLLFIVHVSHATWLTILFFSIDSAGHIGDYVFLLFTLPIAFGLEMLRWSQIGNMSIVIVGPYSHASAIDVANRKFLLASWYVISPMPPFKWLQESTVLTVELSEQVLQRKIFSDFWLSSKITFPLFACCGFIFYGIFTHSLPAFLGLTKFPVVAYLYWAATIGAFCKISAVLLFSGFIRFNGEK